MPRYLILAQSEVTAEALGVWLELLGQQPLEIGHPRRIVWLESGVGAEESGVVAYETLVQRIEMASAEGSGSPPLNDISILVDAVRPENLNPMAEVTAWDALVGMLILTLPEVRWIFGVVTGNSNEILKSAHSLVSMLLCPRRDPLLDATGLRDFVRGRINEKLPTQTNDRVLLPLRKKQAAAIDEENAYALFHAYTAYRFGYRADAVRSWSLMRHLFSGDKGHGFHLLLEDVNLNFPDKPASIHLSSFPVFLHEKHGPNGRAEKCHRLGYGKEAWDDSTFRIIVTSGHSSAEANRVEANQDYVQKNKPNGYGFVLKPVGGMFDLWRKAQLLDRLKPKEYSETARRPRSCAPEFYWPPKLTRNGAEAGGHSAPGKLMLIAQHLVRRADALRDSSNTVEDCLRGAVLATDALELLRYQTPTLALQALELKHEFEVKAEVAFLGVGHQFDLKVRFEDLEEEVHVASEFFQKEHRRAAELDALVSIGDCLMLVFREAGQFDEEEVCLVHIRAWHLELRLRRSRSPLNFLWQVVVVGYAEYLLAKPWRFIAFLALWYLDLLVGWLILHPEKDFIYSASRAFNSFFVANPEQSATGVELALNSFGSLMGLFHLGVFISYLYSAVTRK